MNSLHLSCIEDSKKCKAVYLHEPAVVAQCEHEQKKSKAPISMTEMWQKTLEDGAGSSSQTSNRMSKKFIDNHARAHKHITK